MAKNAKSNPLRSLPQIEEVLRHDAMTRALDVVPHDAAAGAARAAVEDVRRAILEGAIAQASLDDIARDAARRVEALTQRSLRRVVNASGVIVHTNLGRSMLAQEAIDAVDDVIRGYSTLEYSLEDMARGSRHDHCESLICTLTGAEAAIAVNNNAAAVLMVLSQFASGRQAVVSRGELVEIGGSFRIPDIMALSDAQMVEVGTTNKTHVADYERAVTEETGMLLKVHPSNYRMIGFTESVGIAQLRAIADKHASNGGHRPLVYEDQGSGALLALDAFGSYAEPTVRASIEAGADLVSFSGDKLLGGPQAGIIVGRRELIDQLKASPLARALRLDKMTLAALEATLRLYLSPERALESIPTLRMLTESADSVRTRAEELHALVAKRVSRKLAEFSIVPEVSRAGGGALPMCDIPTFALEVRFARGCAQDCERFLVQDCPVPIVARISRETLLCDARTLTDPDELKLVASGIISYFEQLR